MVRTRATYALLALVTIAVGLLVHRRGGALGPVARDVLGDALWAAMIVWWLGALAPSARRFRRASVTLALCFAVEFSQLYHAPALDAFRATTVGHLLLGNGFDPRDLAAYALGVTGAFLLETAFVVVRSRQAAAA